jgi:hypothetical protein
MGHIRTGQKKNMALGEAQLLEVGDCGNKGSGYKLNCYWRIAERCGWKGLAPLNARQGLTGF